MSNRRAFLIMLTGAAVWPIAARAQSAGKMPRIALLAPGRSDQIVDTLNAFLQGLLELGYVEGQTITIERGFADWRPERLRELAGQFVAQRVDVIAAFSTPAARAARQASSTLPIVAFGMADPVADGLVESLARPGGNVTGTTFLGPELVAKRLQMLREMVPGLAQLAALWHPKAYSETTMAGLVRETEVAAKTLGLRLQFLPADRPEDLETAFVAMATHRADALIVLPSPMLYAEYRRIAEFAAANRLPAMGAAREFADLGGLASYGVNLPDLSRQSAKFVDRILKGATPSALPVEQPTKFELVINLKAAKELGLTITREFQLIADEVIE